MFLKVRHWALLCSAVGGILGGAVVLAGGSVSISRAKGGASPIVICNISASSGPFQVLGQHDTNGAKAWAAFVNRSGGLLGHRVRLVTENDESSAATAADVARKCVSEDHAQFVLGPESSTTSDATIPILNAMHVVSVSEQVGWAGTGLSKAAMHGYAFPAVGNIPFVYDEVSAKDIIKVHHYTRVGVVQDNLPGVSTATDVKKLAKTYGYKVVNVQTVEPGATDDTPQVLALLAAKPQYVVLGTFPGTDTLTFIKAMRAQDPTLPLGLCGSCMLPSFISAAGGPSGMKDVYMNGSSGELVTKCPRNAQTKAGITDTATYIAAMRAFGLKSGNDLDNDNIGWDAGRALQGAVLKARSLSEAKVRKAFMRQEIALGGANAVYFARSPENYGNMPKSIVPITVVEPSGVLHVVSCGVVEQG